MATTSKTGIIILGHGSRLAESNELVIKLTKQIRTKLSDKVINYAFLKSECNTYFSAAEKMYNKSSEKNKVIIT